MCCRRGVSRSDRRYCSSAAGSEPNDPSDPDTWDYTPNRLNQYLMVSISGEDHAQGLKFDDNGNLTERFLAADLDGDVDLADFATFQESFTGQ